MAYQKRNEKALYFASILQYIQFSLKKIRIINRLFGLFYTQKIKQPQTTSHKNENGVLTDPFLIIQYAKKNQLFIWYNQLTKNDELCAHKYTHLCAVDFIHLTKKKKEKKHN